MAMKKCDKCGEVKETSEFHKDRNRYDGLCYQCKKCHSAYHREYYERKRDPNKKRRIRNKEQMHSDEMKKCRTCGETKNVSEFYRDSRHTGKFRGECKKCHNVYYKEYNEKTYNQGYRVTQGDTTETKKCGGCGETKEINEFYKCSAKPDGANSWCKKCHNEYMKEHNRLKKLINSSFERLEEIINEQ